MFSDPCSTQIPLDTCKCKSCHCWHRCAGSHVPGHMHLNLNLKRKAHTSLTCTSYQMQSVGLLQSFWSQFPVKAAYLQELQCVDKTSIQAWFSICSFWCSGEPWFEAPNVGLCGISEKLDHNTAAKYAYWNKAGAYVCMFSGLHSIHIPHGTCKYMNHQCWHKCAGNHVPGHIHPILEKTLPHLI